MPGILMVKMVLIYTQHIKGICMQCGEAIFNPICSNCLAKEIETWMMEIKLDKKIQKEIKKKMNILLVNDDKCILNIFEKCVICHKPTTNYCPYCFTELIYNVVKKLVKGTKERNKILKSYFTYFNFDFDHTGYTKEMDKLGMF